MQLIECDLIHIHVMKQKDVVNVVNLEERFNVIAEEVNKMSNNILLKTFFNYIERTDHQLGMATKSMAVHATSSNRQQHGR